MTSKKTVEQINLETINDETLLRFIEQSQKAFSEVRISLKNYLALSNKKIGDIEIKPGSGMGRHEVDLVI